MNRIGVHLGLAAGYGEALEYAHGLGCTTVQIFTHNPRSFSFKPLDKAALAALHKGWEERGIHPIYSHCNYLINLGSSDNRTFYGSLTTVKKELEYARAFGCDYFVLHVGKHKEAGLEAGMRQVAKAINQLGDELRKHDVMILLETVAGQGTEIGVTFEELGQLIKMFDPAVQEHVGVTVDTCHIFAAGYDLRTPAGVERTIQSIEESFGVARVRLIHVNDSKGDCGSRLDRHEHLGMGRIGREGLRNFLTHPKVRGIPMILETPVDERGDQASDMAALREILEQ